jgi:hypothetical protein
MEAHVIARTPGDAAVVFDVLADLATYPQWFELVHRVQPAEPSAADEGPAFLVDLRARVGPLARSKRLRMVRTEHEPHRRVRYDRREVDGRRHSTWELTARLRPLAEGVEVRVDLHYGGHLWSRPLQALLESHIERATPRLQQLIEARS